MRSLETERSDTVGRTRLLDFESFFREEYPGLLKTMYLASGNRAEAEELTQAAMVRAYERWDSVAAASSPSAYVYRIALNLHRSRFRHAAVVLRHRERAAPPHDPADVAIARADTLRALRALSVDDHHALLLVEWLGMSSEDAGRLLGIAASSARSRVQRARESFRRAFGERND
jgi:RNA polymerase sigma factor (sigma-70 family)